MCGIFGYTGPKKNTLEIVIEGLKKLEYRGYDSWGIAYKTDDDIHVYKQVGKIGEFNLKNAQALESRSGGNSGNDKDGNEGNDSIVGEIGAQNEYGHAHIAIGHSRWATHGGVTEHNAHPHYTEHKEVVIAHNGIFENYLELKEQLIERGHLFRSETDSEVIAHWIEEEMKTKDFESATKAAIARVEGRYAILVIAKAERKMIAARRGSPLIIGIGSEPNEYFIASDIPAFLAHTKQIQYLDDDQMVVIDGTGGDQAGARYIDLTTDTPIEKRVITIDWTEQSAQKGDFKHFMIKEIMEQKETLYRAINQDERLIREVADEIKNAFGTYFIGCGTAGKVCMAAEYFFSAIAQKHINTCFGSEFPAHHHFLTNRSLIIAVSQSGETADILESLEIAKKKGAKIISIVNVETSTMARISDIVLPIKAGPEKAVASTKATTSQMTILMLLAYALADKLQEGKSLLINTAGQINDMLNPRYEDHITALADRIKDVESMYIIGRASNFPMALECAIKLQEVSYIHAEGFAGGELKHGPIALITEGTPVIALVANDEYKKAMIGNATEIKARGGYIIGIAPQHDPVFDYWIRVPDVGPASPLVNIIPVQILAYHLALLRQNDPDMPRNLAKSVTVK